MNYRTKALKAFCKLRRLQEANEAGYVQCVTCGKPVKWNECDGGHFIHRRFRGTEVEHDNVWPQCVSCNRFGSITQKEYARKLIEKIGEERVNDLVALKYESYPWRSYKVMAEKYDAEIRRLRKEKGL